jgi:protein associated with RNAse G/E
MPPSINGGILSYIDLDIDILVQPDFSYQVLDVEEFTSNAMHYNYSEQVKKQTQSAIDDLILMIETRQFPFA